MAKQIKYFSGSLSIGSGTAAQAIYTVPAARFAKVTFNQVMVTAGSGGSSSILVDGRDAAQAAGSISITFGGSTPIGSNSATAYPTVNAEQLLGASSSSNYYVMQRIWYIGPGVSVIVSLDASALNGAFSRWSLGVVEEY
jgi:hypothetical protein